MKNRAKCKLCKSIIESSDPYDYTACKCGEISVEGGSEMRCAARDFDNFLRVDDEGNEIIVKVQNDEDIPPKPSREELLKMLDEMLANIEKMPSHAMINPINHYDFSSLLILLSAILRTG